MTINEIFGKLEFFFSSRKLNLYKTFYLNFRSLPFPQAIKFPIYVYEGIEIVSLKGKIVINSPISRGMIKFGCKTKFELIPTHKSRIFNNGTIEFKGNASFSNGFLLYLSKLESKIQIGIDCFFAENISIVSNSESAISIGDYSRIAYNTTINNSDFHFIIDKESRKISHNSDVIQIGKNNWIGNGVRILKRTTTPDKTIVTANAILNKNYCTSMSEGSIIGGMPAKLIKDGQYRVFSLKSEKMLNDFFYKNPSQLFILDKDIDINEFCKR